MPDTAPLNALPRGWQGNLELTYSRTETGTQLSRSVVKAPLKVQQSFYPEGAEVCHSVALHTAGGVVGGDRLSTTIHLEPEAQALITTAAAAKLYRSNGAQAQQTIHITVEPGASLEWLPQETIVFDGAQFQQTMRVELAPDASWLGWDITRFGRSARGERFLSGEWRSHTEVWQDGQLLWVDPQWLKGGSPMLDSPHGLNGCPVVGSMALVGRAIAPEHVKEVRDRWQTLNSQPDSPGEFGITRLTSGILCRYRGHSTLEARRAFLEAWHVLRPNYLHRPVCIPRVWQM
jgi:urease accessory protein